MVGGDAGLVLQHFNDIMYIEFYIGCTFGILDIIGSFIGTDNINEEDWYRY